MILLTDEQLGEIAQELEIGMVCYVHQQTGELIVFPNPEQFTYGDTGDWQESIDTVEASPDDYWPIHPMTSFESFQVMERFVEVLPANHLRTRLITILNQPKPFRHFKQAVDESDYRENWFAFRDGEMAHWLRQKLVNMNALRAE